MDSEAGLSDDVAVEVTPTPAGDQRDGQPDNQGDQGDQPREDRWPNGREKSSPNE